jgi:mono/diheme cytochrome c family protein
MNTRSPSLLPPRRQPHLGLRFGAFHVGFGTALLALACGSENNGGDLAEEDPDPGIRVDPPAPQTCDDNPLLAICQDPRPGGTADDPALGDSQDPGPVGSPADLARAAAENILRSNCGQCHGPALTEEQARAGMNFIDDIERLVAEPARNGQPLIEPRNSDNSLIVQRMRDGSMPPAGSTGPRPSASDIRTVANFIDNPNFWDEPARRDCTGQEISYDEIYQRIQADLFRQDADDRQFTRYLSLTNRYNAGICSDDLDRDRWAMAKMVNMLSINTGLVEPVAIDREQTL